MKKLVSVEKGKGIVWGISPFPIGLEPILADIGFGSLTYGVLFRSKVNQNLFANGQAGEIKSVHPQVAKELITEYKASDERSIKVDGSD